MLDAARSLLKRLVGREPEVLEQYAAVMSGRRLAMLDAEKRVKELAGFGSAAEMLSALQAIEVEACDEFRWPWYAWRSVDVAFPTLRFPATDTLLGQALLDDVFAVRCGTLGKLQRHFTEPQQLLKQAKQLAPAFQVELLFYAFIDKRWMVLSNLSASLLEAWQAGRVTLHARIAEIVFELHLRAILRLGMPTFVNRATDLTDQLDALAENEGLLRKIGMGSNAVRCFQAARCAFGGDIKGAVALYDEANRADGFRTPIFNPAQTLVPIEEAAAASDTELSTWFARYSQIEHHFRHPGADKHAVLVASEQHYFDKYAELYVEALSMSNPGALVHFHLISMTTDKSALLATLNGWEITYGLKLNCSFEENRIMREATPFTSGVSVTTRYIYMLDYLEAYSGLTLTDIDGCLMASLDDVSDFGTHDALISSWIWRENTGRWRLPWANLAGGYISFRSTEASKRFVALLRRYLIIVTRNNVQCARQLVYSDQAGVFLALQYGVKHWGHSVGFMPKKGFSQSFEQRLEFRSAGKAQAMREKLEELKTKKD